MKRKIPQVKIPEKYKNLYWIEGDLERFNNELMCFFPETQIQINEFWNKIRVLRETIIIEFQNLTGMPYFDFVQNYVNGSMTHFNEFQTFIKRIGETNKLEKRFCERLEALGWRKM